MRLLCRAVLAQKRLPLAHADPGFFQIAYVTCVLCNLKKTLDGGSVLELAVLKRSGWRGPRETSEAARQARSWSWVRRA